MAPAACVPAASAPRARRLAAGPSTPTESPWAETPRARHVGRIDPETGNGVAFPEYISILRLLYKCKKYTVKFTTLNFRKALGLGASQARWIWDLALTLRVLYSP